MYDNIIRTHTYLSTYLPTYRQQVRAGTGGDEASLFAQEVFAMYEKYATANRWRFEILNLSKNEFGGIKEAAASLQGLEAYVKLKVG